MHHCIIIIIIAIVIFKICAILTLIVLMWRIG